MSNMTPPPPPGSFPQPPASGGDASEQSQKGLVARVFDLSFSEFVTPSIIKIIFVVLIVVAGIMSLGIFAALARGGGAGVLAGLIIAPLFFCFYVLMARVASEVYLILFRIEANTRK